MYKHLLAFALLLTTITATAQKAVIKGKVVDSLNNKPISLVTVAILDVKDTTSSLLVYTVTDKNGTFTLHNLPTGTPLKVLISVMAYQPYRKIFTLAKGQTLDLGNIGLNPKLLNEIVINGERPPIVIRKDTIEFNTEAFKTRPNAIVEELLRKLPGMEVSMDGKLNFNGKDIKKVYVDGHEFFNNDYRIATKNLDADMIDKVQIYDDREDDPDHLVPENQVQKIINLKFKKALKKSIFSKLYAGAGTEDRYTGGALFNMFRDTLQVSLLGQTNNLNSTGFSFDDLYNQGGFMRGGGETFAKGGLSPFNFGRQGIEKILADGVNINTDYGKKLKINLAYYYTHKHTDFNSITNRQQLVSDTNFTTNSINSNLNLTNTHNISATVRWKPNDATQITYNPTAIFNDNSNNGINTVNSYSNFIPKIAFTDNSNNSTGNSMQLQQSFNYNHQFKKPGESIDISHNLQVNPGNSTGYNISNLTSYIATLTPFNLNRNSNSLNRGTDVNLSVGYRYPISKKLVANIGISDDYNHQVNNTITYDLNTADGQYDLFLQTLSTNLTRNLWTEGLNPGLTYNFKQGYQIVVGGNTQVLQVNNRFDRNFADIDQHFVNFLPIVNLNLGSYSLSYQRSFNLPNIGDMIPYTVTSSPLYSVTGNPNLKPTTRDNYNFNHSVYGGQSQLSLNLGASTSIIHNSIIRQNTLNAVGGTTSMPINMDGEYRLSENARIGKRFKQNKGWHFSEYTSLRADEGRGNFLINGQSGYQHSYAFSLDQQFSLDYKDILQLEQSYNLNNTITNYTGVNFNNVNNFTHVLNTHVIVTTVKKINIESTYTYTYNPLVSPGFQKSANLLNLSIARSIFKNDRGEIKLSCYDLLNQNISSSRFVNANVINDVQSEVLKRYVLLTFQFRFRKSTVKGDDKPKPNMFGGLRM